MRIIYKRNCGNYVFTIGLVTCMICLYIIGLKHSKHTGTTFNLKSVKIKRDVHKVTYGKIEVSKSNWSNSVRFDTVLTKKLDVHHLDKTFKQVGGNKESKTIVSVTPNVDSKSATLMKELNIYIVEEHHEVLTYWFAAANRGTIPKSGNTLIHIDGHSDLAPPIYIPGYPFFRWPSEKQLTILMQGNDVFIQAAAMAGLINRVIWVWPDWDRQNHEDDFIMTTLSLGWFQVQGSKSSAKEKGFCMCARNNTGIECRSLTKTGPSTKHSKVDNNIEGYLLPKESCHINKVVIVEEIHENKALAYLGKSNWISRKDEHILLDVDEDYYGCTYSIGPILSANFSSERLKNLEFSISHFFCPSTTVHERESDKILMNVLSVIRKQKACRYDLSIHNSTNCQEILKHNASWQFMEQLNSSISKNFIRTCKYDNMTDSFVNSFIQQLNNMRITQIRALQIVGFCSRTSPKTYQYLRKQKFGICFGANTPQQSVVSEHMPTKTEIAQRSVVLTGILRKLKEFSPRLVTISRSIRDGFTPKEHFEQIESDIIMAINSTMDKDVIVHYDKDLLGGKPGWPSRHKV